MASFAGRHFFGLPVLENLFTTIPRLLLPRMMRREDEGHCKSGAPEGAPNALQERFKQCQVLFTLLYFFCELGLLALFLLYGLSFRVGNELLV